jgi:hypothetical protein
MLEKNYDCDMSKRVVFFLIFRQLKILITKKGYTVRLLNSEELLQTILYKPNALKVKY